MRKIKMIFEIILKFNLLFPIIFSELVYAQKVSSQFMLFFSRVLSIK